MQNARISPLHGKDEHSMRGSEAEVYTIVLASKDESMIRQLSGSLAREGRTFVEITEAPRIVQELEQAQPGVILLDVDMIEGDFSLVDNIRACSQDSYLPVILLMPDQDASASTSCLGVGDDVISKSCITCNPELLEEKIRSLMRFSMLYGRLRQQKRALKAHQQVIDSEQQTARHLFEKFLHSEILHSAGIRYMQRSMGMFNGDLLLAAHKPTGGIRLMVGDMTGHGLSAAVGSVPTSEIFYSMTAKGYAVSDILVEINNKLHRLLPTGHFCAACIVDFECSRQQITVWNGGMPDILLLDNDRRIVKERIGSCALPLGIVDGDALNTSVLYVDIMPGDHLYLCSDGITEARNPLGEMFGQQRLLESVLKQGRDTVGFDRIREDFESFVGKAPISDDTTLVEITCGRALLEQDRDEESEDEAHVRPPTAWSVEMRLEAQALRATDPRPLLTQLVMDLQGMQKHRDRLFTVLAELFSNALEHGVLGLDSALKYDSQGFAEYYEQRRKKLDCLEDGWIRIALDHVPTGCSGELHITIEDSGQGFELSNSLPGLLENTAHSGRGIALVRSLCRELVYQGRGNVAHAVYAWDNCEPPCQ